MMKNEWKQDLAGWWILLLLPVVYYAGGRAGLYFSEMAYVPSQRVGGDPPFYIMRGDFIQGIAIGGSGLFAAAMGLFFWRRCHVYAWMVVWMSILWTGGPLVKSVIIAFNTTDILSPLTSESSWLTLEDYLNDPVIWVSQVVILILAIATAFVFRPRRRAHLDDGPSHA